MLCYIKYKEFFSIFYKQDTMLHNVIFSSPRRNYFMILGRSPDLVSIYSSPSHDLINHSGIIEFRPHYSNGGCRGISPLSLLIYINRTLKSYVFNFYFIISFFYNYSIFYLYIFIFYFIKPIFAKYLP